MSRLIIVVEPEGRVVVDGEVDSSSASELGEGIRSCKGDVRVDLSNCRFMDSTGIAALLEARAVVEAQNASFVLVAPSRPVMKLLEICGLLDVLEIESVPMP